MKRILSAVFVWRRMIKRIASQGRFFIFLSASIFAAWIAGRLGWDRN